MHYDDPHDPLVILRALPAQEHAFFLSQYRAKVDAAHEPAGYGELRDFLHAWSLAAHAMSEPGYAEALNEARTATSPGISLEEMTAMRHAGQ
ncbi:hypothetical protein DFJ69_5903 [Thermomonospora umbrina]|uniref:Uncharacterized protein n=1 Tax=Thermomonospora umbrina TaxID=111806 RepID=A0A3D9T0N5_9ACTN|nr:hypothetical protein DFJ69_5903 [Thermomonospora umbrina]